MADYRPDQLGPPRDVEAPVGRWQLRGFFQGGDDDLKRMSSGRQRHSREKGPGPCLPNPGRRSGTSRNGLRDGGNR